MPLPLFLYTGLETLITTTLRATLLAQPRVKCLLGVIISKGYTYIFELHDCQQRSSQQQAANIARCVAVAVHFLYEYQSRLKVCERKLEWISSYTILQRFQLKSQRCICMFEIVCKSIYFNMTSRAAHGNGDKLKFRACSRFVFLSLPIYYLRLIYLCCGHIFLLSRRRQETFENPNKFDV